MVRYYMENGQQKYDPEEACLGCWGLKLSDLADTIVYNRENYHQSKTIEKVEFYHGVYNVHFDDGEILALDIAIGSYDSFSMDGTIVRYNLLNTPSYTPFCANDNCSYRWPRTTYHKDKQQFTCSCGWESKVPDYIMSEYKRINNL